MLGGGESPCLPLALRGSPCTQSRAPSPVCSVLHSGRWGSHFPSNGAVVHVPWPSLSYACLFPQKAPVTAAKQPEKVAATRQEIFQGE